MRPGSVDGFHAMEPLQQAYTDMDNGIVVNSDFLNGLTPTDATVAATKYLEEKGIGSKKVNYKLRDWIFSRQRY